MAITGHTVNCRNQCHLSSSWCLDCHKIDSGCPATYCGGGCACVYCNDNGVHKCISGALERGPFVVYHKVLFGLPFSFSLRCLLWLCQPTEIGPLIVCVILVILVYTNAQLQSSVHILFTHMFRLNKTISQSIHGSQFKN